MSQAASEMALILASCVIPSPSVWPGPGDLLLTNRIQQKRWDVTYLKKISLSGYFTDSTPTVSDFIPILSFNHPLFPVATFLLEDRQTHTHTHTRQRLQKLEGAQPPPAIVQLLPNQSPANHKLA